MVIATPKKLWEPPNPEDTGMYKFMQTVNKKHGLNLKVCTFSMAVFVVLSRSYSTPTFFVWLHA